MRLLVLGVVLLSSVACASTRSTRTTPTALGRAGALTEVRPDAGLSVAVVRIRDRARDAADEGRFEACRELHLAAAEHTRGHAKATDTYAAAVCAARGNDASSALGLAANALRLRPQLVARFDRDEAFAALRSSDAWQTLTTEARSRARRTDHPRLTTLFVEDQADRNVAPDRIDFASLERRDASRVGELERILAAGEARTANDFYYAAMLLQHASTLESYARAHAFCLKAMALDPSHDEAIWLAAATLDRHLMTEGRPQRFGTQLVNRDGAWRVWDVTPGLTDEQRAVWGVRPLADQHARAVEMNAER